MSYSVVIGGEQQSSLASTGGWRDVRSYVDQLDAKPFGELVGFVEHGLSQELTTLQQQISAAMKASPPPPDVAHTLVNLSALLARRSPDSESAFVSDGLGVDDGGEDWSAETDVSG